MSYVLRGLDIASGVNVNSINHVQVTADLSATTWKSKATHEVFTITGMVRVYLWAECTEDCASAGDTAQISFGHESDTAAFIAATNEDALDAGDIWYDVTPTTFIDTPANVIFDRVIMGLDVGYEITGEATTDGTLVFHACWEPLSIGASVVAGSGGPL
jgi:hypothetical protein